MKGYWDDEKKTKETIDSDNWIHSGDIGSLD
jgi:long-subunit acyl-CoA synthetase (AMP-forming)